MKIAILVLCCVLIAVPYGSITHAACPCPFNIDNVCGNDGQTYVNKCTMECDGVQWAHDGPCAE